jgi:hypothetical protein
MLACRPKLDASCDHKTQAKKQKTPSPPVERAPQARLEISQRREHRPPPAHYLPRVHLEVIIKSKPFSMKPLARPAINQGTAT